MTNPRKWLLPAGAVAAVAIVLGVMLGAGGAGYGSPERRDPCSATLAAPEAASVEALSQSVVLAGVDRTACELGITRERLILALADDSQRARLAADAQTDAAGLARIFKRGLQSGVDRLADAGALPPVSQIKDEIIDQADVPELVRSALRALPDSVVDGLLPTRTVLHRAIDGTDIAAVLAGLDDPDALEPRLRAAVRRAAIAEARAQIERRLGSLGGLL